MRNLLLPLIRHAMRLAGLKYGAHRLVELFLRNKDGWELSRDRWGNIFLLNLRNYCDARLYLAGSYEEEEIRIFKKYVTELQCSAFIDIGANIGLYTVNLGKLASIVQVHAFEPDQLNRQQLNANILINGLSNKTSVYCVALSSQKGTTTLYRCSTPHEFDANKVNTGSHSLQYNPKWHDDAIEITSERGDDILSFRGERLAIKIDVEGHEQQVIKGMSRLLTENQCILLIESMPNNYHSTEKLLNSLGYTLYRSLKDNNYIFSNIPSIDNAK
ncbi:MAG: hypothetical protein KatS3mg039_1644 [Candidatus Kapaibacterium sp.]|jgi:FkbM family methyltransferase|nr:MAG: hypothetical protein KatS3mg039_1644 [Candidatus Kapabacteria bacterium]